jgi:hypothetical protein
MTNKILDLIEDKSNQSRDLFEGHHLSEAIKIQSVFKLLQTVETEENPSVIESIYNLFGIAFDDNICKSEIADKCMQMLDRLEPGSLMHAIPIIAVSDLENKKALILNYLNSGNPAVEKIAEESLQQIS